MKIRVADPLGGPDRYAYIAAVKHPRLSPVRYVDYDPATERIETDSYRLGFKRQLPDDFRLQNHRGEVSNNLISGFELRGKVTVLSLLQFHLTETDIDSRLLAYRIGPVRVIRRLGHRIRVFLGIRFAGSLDGGILLSRLRPGAVHDALSDAQAVPRRPGPHRDGFPRPERVFAARLGPGSAPGFRRRVGGAANCGGCRGGAVAGPTRRWAPDVADLCAEPGVGSIKRRLYYRSLPSAPAGQAQSNAVAAAVGIQTDGWNSWAAARIVSTRC